MTVQRVLIVDDEAGSRRGLSELLKSWGHVTETAADGAEGISKVETFRPQVIIADLVMPRMDGMELLEKLSDRLARLTFVMLTAKGSIASAVEAMKRGAFDYLTKPVDTSQLRVIMANTAARSQVWKEIEHCESDLQKTGRFGKLVGRSVPMQKLYHQLRQAGPSAASVLIVGESGTGKELVARMLHDLSPRRKEPFVALNCAAIPEALLESEIFGHERGAFTGAETRRLGCFETANRGTLFLDEVAEMAPSLQVKLLRVLEERSFRRLGTNQEIRVDVRVVAATNRDPESVIREGQLRQDLYYRLNVFVLELPTLRERLEDVPLLVQHFTAEFLDHAAAPPKTVDPEAMLALRSYSWPGNVRELRNVMERAMILSPGRQITIKELPAFVLSADRTDSPDALNESEGAFAVKVGTTVEQAERDLILKTLESTGQNKTRAAEILGISLKTLHNKLKKYRKSD